MKCFNGTCARLCLHDPDRAFILINEASRLSALPLSWSEASCGLWTLHELPECAVTNNISCFLLTHHHLFLCCSCWPCCFGSVSRWLILRFSADAKTLCECVSLALRHFKAGLFFRENINNLPCKALTSCDFYFLGVCRCSNQASAPAVRCWDGAFSCCLCLVEPYTPVCACCSSHLDPARAGAPFLSRYVFKMPHHPHISSFKDTVPHPPGNTKQNPGHVGFSFTDVLHK